MPTTLTNLAPPASGAGTQNLSDLVQSLAPSGGQNVTQAIAQLSTQMQQLNAVNATQRQAISDNTAALTTNTQTKGQSAASAIGDQAKGLLGSALSALPLFSTLAGLFNQQSAPPVLTRYSQALPVSVQKATSGGQAGAANYDQYGQPRSPDSGHNLVGLNSILGSSALATLNTPYTPQSNANYPSRPGSDPGVTSAQNPISSGAGPQITVNVNAMDSRSFLDRSGDIAHAVREAMLNMHPLNDVINDL